VGLLLLLCGQASADPAAESSQLVTVRGHGWNDRAAELQRWERREREWVRVGKPIAVVLGGHGLGWGAGLVTPSVEAGEPRKREGDLRSPAGLFRLGTVTGYAPTAPPSATLPYRVASDDKLRCVDDAKAPEYNQLADAPASGSTTWHSDEKMHRTDGLYELTIFVEHNADRKAGHGSCIFLHIWRSAGAGTAGCTAMPRADLFTLVSWLKADAHPLLLQAPAAAWDRLAVAAGIKLP